MPKLPAIGELVLIHWHDAGVDVGWTDNDDAKTHLIQSVGWVQRKKNQTIVLASDKSPDPTDKETNRRLAIPSAWISSVTILRSE